MDWTQELKKIIDKYKIGYGSATTLTQTPGENSAIKTTSCLSVVQNEREESSQNSNPAAGSQNNQANNLEKNASSQ